MESQPQANQSQQSSNPEDVLGRPVQRHTLDISSINRPDLTFQTIGTVRHCFSCPKALELMSFARNIEQLVALCRSIELHVLSGLEYLVLIESMSLGSWLIMKSTFRQQENSLVTILGKSFQIGGWVICEGTITQNCGTGMYWNDYLTEIDRYRKHRERTNRFNDQCKEQDDRMDERNDLRIKDTEFQVRTAKVEHIDEADRP